MPTNSSVIPGVRTGSRKNKESAAGQHYVEDILIEREDTVEMAQKQQVVDLPLCETYVLPKGEHCHARTEVKGLYFCAGGKEGCPLKV